MPGLCWDCWAEPQQGRDIPASQDPGVTGTASEKLVLSTKKKKSFKIPSLAVLAIYILCRKLKTKRNRCHQIVSDGVGFGDFFS